MQGHMMEAAVAHHQSTGKDNFMKVALKAANMIDYTFGPGKLEKYSGHQEIFVLLFRLIRVHIIQHSLQGGMISLYVDCYKIAADKFTPAKLFFPNWSPWHNP